MEGKVFDFAVCEVFGGVRFQWHAVIAHPFWSMPAHLLILGSRDFAIELVQSAVERRLLDYFPDILYRGCRQSKRRGSDGKIFGGKDRETIQSV